MTPAEKILWAQLRNRRFSAFKFRRQQPVDRYVVDFYCPTTRLVVELDGESHVGKDVHDAVRQTYLESQGLRVVRFWNTMVYEELDVVLQVVWELCNDPDHSTSLYPRHIQG